MDAVVFSELAKQGFNRIPVVREVLADLDTPLSTYLKLANGPYSYLFESVQGGEKWGRYSIIGLPCRTVLRVTGQRIDVLNDGEIIESHEVADPLTWIEKFQTRYKVAELDGLPRFNGGLVGYFGYDTIRYIEPKLAKCSKPDPLKNPDILLMVSDEVIVFDNLRGKLYMVVHADPAQSDALAQAQARLDVLDDLLHQAAPRYTHPGVSRVNEADFISGFTQEGFEEAVARCKDYIVDGDIMQVVLSQRMSISGHVTAAGYLPRPALPESIAVHVLSESGRFSYRRLVTGNTGAARRRYRHRAPDCRHAPRGATLSRIWRWNSDYWPIPKNWPNT